MKNSLILMLLVVCGGAGCGSNDSAAAGSGSMDDGSSGAAAGIAAGASGSGNIASGTAGSAGAAAGSGVAGAGAGEGAAGAAAGEGAAGEGAAGEGVAGEAAAGEGAAGAAAGEGAAGEAAAGEGAAGAAGEGTAGEGVAGEGGVAGVVCDLECEPGQFCSLMRVECIRAPCPPVATCVDAPFCGGFAGFACAGMGECVDDPRDDCNPERGGADCGGICTCPTRGRCTDRERWNPAADVCACEPIADAGGEACGDTTCEAGMVCCNASCGICAPPDGFCTQQACSPRS